MEDSSACSRTKRHLLEVGDKISAFTMGCSTKMNRCTTWLCAKNGGGGNLHSYNDVQSPTAEVMQGPGPSPGSSGSCDDSQPPAKNCYRLVMLG